MKGRTDRRLPENQDLRRALAGSRARAVIMPASTDLYFPPEDSALEVALLPQGELRVIETDWGHSAGGPDRNRSDFIESTLYGPRSPARYKLEILLLRGAS